MTNHITLSDFPASCSCMKLTSKQGRPYWFRTCDLNTSILDAGAHAVSFPADYAITTANGTLRTRYALLGMSYCTVDSWLLDGVNSEGLVGGLLLLEEGTSIPAAEAGSSGVMGMELVTALLATCRDVTEVCQAAKDIRITDIPAETGFLPATMHYFFLDAAGNTVVLEATDPTQPGRLTCYREDSIGVMTNSPPYPRQLDNLRWFLSQSPELHHGGDDCPICQPAWEGVRLAAAPSALHMTQSGVLPASYAPYDRFVRLAVLKALNHDGQWIDDAQILPLGSGLLHSVFEPHSRGVYHYRRLDEHGMPAGRSDGYTQYCVMYAPEQHAMYLQPFDSTAWTKIALRSCDTALLQRHPINRSAMAGVVER